MVDWDKITTKSPDHKTTTFTYKPFKMDFTVSNELVPVMYNDFCYNPKEDDMAPELNWPTSVIITNEKNGFSIRLFNHEHKHVFNSWNDMVEFLNEEFNPFEEEE